MTKRLLIVLLLALAALGLLTNVFQTEAVQEVIQPTFTQIPSPTTFVVTTLVPSPTPGCAAPLNFVVGATVFVKGGVYVRTQPNGSSPWVNYYSSAAAVTIISGPVCDGLRYNWWQVKGPGNDGWVAEGSPGRYFMRLGALPGPQCQSAVNLTVGKRAMLLRDLNVHDQPAETGLVLTVASTGQFVDVLEGPSCADDQFNWWKISVTVVGFTYTGWVADAQPGGNDWLISEDTLNAPVCGQPLALVIGSHAFINYTDHIPKNLRSGPSNSSQLIATLLDGIGMQIMAGPVCADGYNWWQVSILSRPDVTGWVAEGGPQGFWITSPDMLATRPR